jgi:hypothetical protein
VLQFNRLVADASAMTFSLEQVFAPHYEVEILDSVRRDLGIKDILGYPGANVVDAQRELNAGPILAIRPTNARPWIGVFPGHANSRILDWPDRLSVCVVSGPPVFAFAVVVRTDDPDQWFEIGPFTDLRPIPEHDVVVSVEWTILVAYNAAGVAWKTSRLAWDDLEIVRAEGDQLVLRGFDASGGSHPEFTVDLRTGTSDDCPHIGDG